MFRSIETKLHFKGQSLITKCRLVATQTAKVSDIKFQDEWNGAKSFDSIPGMTKLQAIRSFLPGGSLIIFLSFQVSAVWLIKCLQGKYYKKSLVEIHKWERDLIERFLRFTHVNISVLFTFTITERQKMNTETLSSFRGSSGVHRCWWLSTSTMLRSCFGLKGPIHTVGPSRPWLITDQKSDLISTGNLAVCWPSKAFCTSDWMSYFSNDLIDLFIINLKDKMKIGIRWEQSWTPWWWNLRQSSSMFHKSTQWRKILSECECTDKWLIDISLTFQLF